MTDRYDSVHLASKDIQRAWLLQNEERDQDGNTTNWWLSIIQPVSTRISFFSSEPSKDAWARFAVTSIETAEEVGAISADEASIRLSNLSVVLTRARFNPEKIDPALASKNIIHRALTCIDLTHAEASQKSRNWPEQPIETTRSLRRIKNLIRPVLPLVDHVHDEKLKQRLAQWRDLLPQLP
ncbi:hypothetical protein [Desmospora activa]|uniref:Uncharacterized protein n=1 Tax=Desmospora activa DSM 45169 TaxID=1121389 RepID=A0A2T4Z0I6_9BACL|nr:hypothetical protein [Desmospora activa]PTM53258.1 hypothetical protein C8J48_3582 [Desmospora activa DSM 45169]